MVLIFWPLLFPDRIGGNTGREDVAGMIVTWAFFGAFAIGAFVLCKRFTRRFVAPEKIVAKRMLGD
jgi:hypothetical protein